MSLYINVAGYFDVCEVRKGEICCFVHLGLALQYVVLIDSLHYARELNKFLPSDVNLLIQQGEREIQYKN